MELDFGLHDKYKRRPLPKSPLLKLQEIERMAMAVPLPPDKPKPLPKRPRMLALPAPPIRNKPKPLPKRPQMPPIQMPPIRNKPKPLPKRPQVLQKPKKTLTEEQKYKMKMGRQRNAQLRAAGELPPVKRKQNRNTPIKDALHTNRDKLDDAKTFYYDEESRRVDVAEFISTLLENLASTYEQNYEIFEAADPKFKRKYVLLMQHIDNILQKDLNQWKNLY